MSHKILFVDEDKKLLNSLKLHFSKKFDVSILSTADEVLKHPFVRDPVAIVVSELHLPDINGVELFFKLRELSPNTIRILHTAQPDYETALNAINQGHIFQFFNKPCSQKIFLDGIEEAILEYKRLIKNTEKNVNLYNEELKSRQKLYSLNHASKLESMGILCSGIIHEISTPLQYIGDNLNFLKNTFLKIENSSQIISKKNKVVGNKSNDLINEKSANGQKKVNIEFLKKEVPMAIDQSLVGISQITKIVDVINQFSHPSDSNFVPLDVCRLIERVCIMTKGEWKNKIHLETVYASQIPEILGSESQLFQVFLNLIKNAIHSVKSENVKDSKIIISIDVKNKDLEIKVTDNGEGIPQNVQDKIFEPFYTTKLVGEGSGLGLAIAHEIVVNKHGGKIFFTPADDGGATFVVLLPFG